MVIMLKAVFFYSFSSTFLTLIRQGGLILFRRHFMMTLEGKFLVLFVNNNWQFKGML